MEDSDLEDMDPIWTRRPSQPQAMSTVHRDTKVFHHEDVAWRVRSAPCRRNWKDVDLWNRADFVRTRSVRAWPLG